MVNLDHPEADDAAPDPSRSPRRLHRLDQWRGVAVLAMVIFHLSWDLYYFNIVDWPVAQHPGWIAFARAIAGTFLFISGINFFLAYGEQLALAKFKRRWLTVAASAAVITIATFIATPGFYIFFGILHSIALGSLLLVLLRSGPAWLLGLLAAAILAIGWRVHSTLFDAPALLFLGLNARAAQSSDFVPLFPFFGVMLAGYAMAKAAGVRRLTSLFGGNTAASPALRWLAVIGRWSLPIYLLHQPILVGVLYGLVTLQLI